MKAKTNRSAAVYVAVVVVVVGALGLGTVSGMPPGIAVVAAVMLGFLIYVVNPSLMNEMLDRPIGIAVLAVAGVMTAIGSMIISKIVRIDI